MAGQHIIMGPFAHQGELSTTLKLYHYVAGSVDTLKHVYTDRDLTTTATQPLLPDSNGVFQFYAAGLYKFVLTDTNDAAISSWDNHDVNAPIPHTGTGRSFLTLSPSTGLPAWAESLTYPVSTDFIPDGGDDGHTAIQAMLNTIDSLGFGTLELRGGKTYYISQALVVGSNTRILGNGATIKALQGGGFVGTNALNTCYLIRNKNHGHNNIPSSITQLTDANIHIQDVNFDYGSVTVAGGGAHAISMRYVDGVTVQNCTSNKGENLTAFLACRDTKTLFCHATDWSNAAFDHWDGAGEALVLGCTGRSSVDCAQGIQFTGTGTNGENRTSSNCIAAYNQLFGVRHASAQTASAIISNANDAGSFTYRFLSIGNYIEDADNGIVFSGAGGQHTSIGDTLNGVDQVPLFMQTADGNSPSHCRFLDPHLIDCDVDASSFGLTVMTGTAPEVRGLRVTNSGAAPYPYLVWISSSATNAMVDIALAPDGTTGRILDQGTTSRIYRESVSWTPDLAFGGASVSLTYTSRSAHYTRHGDTVTVSGNIVVNSNGSSSGQPTISLPVTAKASTTPGIITVYLTGASGLTSAVHGLISSGGTTMALYDYGATGATALSEANIPNGTTIAFNGAYRVEL